MTGGWSQRVRLSLALFWLLTVGGGVLYLLLRRSPDASNLLLPMPLIRWLNWAHDLRTLPMALAYAVPPALLLGREPKLRRWVLAATLLVLVSGEVLQLWIPSRVFTALDLIYSILGVTAAEWIGRQKRTPADTHQS